MAGLRSQKIKMTSIGALTLHSDKLTTARRGSPISQLTCKGKACKLFQPTTVQCLPMGEDGMGGLEWKCEAELPSIFKFGSVEISCEGWDSPQDPYVLRGSCGLEYNLIRSSTAFEEGSYSNQSQLPWSKLIYGSIALYILYRLLTIPFNRYPAVPRPIRNLWRGFGGGGGGGGGGSGGGGAPPPPYSKNQNQPGTEGYRPGFWTGLAAGAAALQAANMLRGQQQQGGYRRNTGWNLRNDDAYDRGVGGSGMFRGGNGGGGGFGGGGGGGAAMRPSTGFGGTRNR